MNEDRTLVIRSLVAIAVGAVAVALCYFLVDRPVAWSVHNHGLNKIVVFEWLTYPPPIVQSWSPLVLVLLVVRRAWGPWRQWQLVLFVACVSLIIAYQFRYSMGQMAGRYWPETWHDNNPSLIGTDTYGFHLFHGDDFDQGSFPSGHATRVVSFLSVFWLTMPRGRWLCLLIAVPILIAMVAMNYHFVGDVVAGSVIGALVGTWAVRFCPAGETNSGTCL
jgi:membrane-associated phospholipid phosphatase